MLEQNSLDEFMQFAEMSQKKFEAERIRGHQVEMQTSVVNGADNNAAMLDKFVDGVHNPQYKPLKIPRRPAWTKEMTKEEIN